MKWFEELTKDLREVFFEKHDEEMYTTAVLAEAHFDDGSFLEVELNRKNNVDVFLYHADEKVKRPCPNITAYIEDHLPDWDDLMEEYKDANVAMDEWQQHGFRNEADYWQYRGI